MAVKEITAWQISTGTCYPTKRQAYHEEMVYLMNTRGSSEIKGFDLATFDQAVDVQTGLVDELKALRKSLSVKNDSSILAEVTALLDKADSWLKEAVELRDSIELEMGV